MSELFDFGLILIFSAAITAIILLVAVIPARLISKKSEDKVGHLLDTVDQLAELNFRLQKVAAHLGDNKLYAAYAVYHGNFIRSTETARFAKFKGVSIDRLCEFSHAPVGTNLAMNRVQRILNQVSGELKNSRHQRDAEFDQAYTFTFKASRTQLVRLSGELANLTQELDQLIADTLTYSSQTSANPERCVVINLQPWDFMTTQSMATVQG